MRHSEFLGMAHGHEGIGSTCISMRQRSSQRGYSLFELIVVMFVIMMLAVNSLPRYLKLYRSVQMGALHAMASSLSTSSSANYVKSKYQKEGWFKVSNCVDVLQGISSPMPKRYTIIPQAIAAGKTTSCILTDDEGQEANFVAVGTQ